MKNRLTKIYTKTGDKGMTGLGSGQRVRKDHLRVEAYGCVDELNSTIGLLYSYVEKESIKEQISLIQNTLFDLGGELCLPDTAVIEQADVEDLENKMDAFNEHLPPLKEFILPGGNAAQGFCHLARTVARRTERRLVTLSAEEDINKFSVSYINRLSDYLFVLARVLAREPSGREVLWQRRQPKT